jgi:hypothetical protein
VPQLDQSRTPASGEPLILSDGRRFLMSRAEHGLRGWWFTATAQDGSCTLQGNLALEWDSRAHVWRPKGTPSSTGPDMALPPSMRSAPSPKRLHVD